MLRQCYISGITLEILVQCWNYEGVMAVVQYRYSAGIIGVLPRCYIAGTAFEIPVQCWNYRGVTAV